MTLAWQGSLRAAEPHVRDSGVARVCSFPRSASFNTCPSTRSRLPATLIECPARVTHLKFQAEVQLISSNGPVLTQCQSLGEANLERGSNPHAIHGIHLHPSNICLSEPSSRPVQAVSASAERLLLLAHPRCCYEYLYALSALCICCCCFLSAANMSSRLIAT